MKKIAILLYISLLILLFTGCWSQKELTNITFVTAIGIDREKDGRYLVTYQLVNPKNLIGTQQQSGIQGTPVTIYQGSGDSLSEAQGDVMQHVSRQIYFSHTNLVVIGEDLAKEGITDIFDYLERTTEFRITADVVVSKEHSAADLLKILTPIDQLPSNKITKVLQYGEKNTGLVLRSNIGEIMDGIYYIGISPVITGFTFDGDVKKGSTEENLKSSKPEVPIVSSGLALFKDDKLVTWATNEEARGIIWIKKKIDKTLITIDWKEYKEAINFITVRSSVKISPSMKKGKPTIHIHVNTEGDINEVTAPIDLSNPIEIEKIEKELSKEIDKEIQKSIELAKQYKTDVFGFGDLFRKDYPKEWKTMKSEWHDHIFPELDVKVSSNAYVRRTELRIKPFFYERKKHEGVEK